MVIVVFGLPGSGKSFLATKLAERMEANYVSSDQLRFAMLRERTYTESEKESVYEEMLNKTKEYLLKQKDIVLDATFYSERLRKKFQDAVSPLSKVFFVEVQASDFLIRKRVDKKRPDSEADYSVYEKVKAQWEPFIEDHLVVESKENNIEDMLQQVFRYVDEQK